MGALGTWKFHELSGRIEALEEAESNESELKELDKTSGDNKTNYETYLNLMFPSNGKLYEPKSNDIVFYSDSDCTNKIENVKFASKTVRKCEFDDWRSRKYSWVYCYRMSNDKICYSIEELGYEKFEECK